MTTEKTNPWKIIKAETIGDRTCELRYAEFGKGRAKAKYWRMFIDDEQVSYASIASDVEANWRYTLARAAEMGARA